jgi:hypothetical protein
MAFVEQHHAVLNHWGLPGIYVGDVGSFDDILHFWNLRATDTQLRFYDPVHAPRLKAWCDAWLDTLPPAQSLGRAGEAAVWSRRDYPFDVADIGRPVARSYVDQLLWNGFNVKAPIMYFGAASVLASIDRLDTVPKLTFALAERPKTENGSLSDQKYVVSVEPGIGLYKDDLNTLHLPFMPELNEFYGRNAHYRYDAARSEPESLGIFVSGSTDHLTMHAIDATRLITAVFKSAGIAASSSSAGRVCSRLIRQMGGLDDCRVFRIGGVRDLIENHNPDQSFTRSMAKLTILAEGTDHPLADYQSLYIEQRDPGSRLTNDAVLAHLLNKEIFRPGLKLSCPSCRLEFWRSVDDARTKTECEYCGHVFNLGPQLKDRDWAFRRSGLFGRNDNQEGALPVILTLQQLANTLDMSGSTFATALELTSDGADIAKCETDFVLMPKRMTDSKVEIVIGECKTRQPITAQDVDNLRRVADAFPSDRFSVFVVFSKLGDFNDDEIGLIQALNQDHRCRAIMLTTRELEPWHVYELTQQEFDIGTYGVSLSDMALVTKAVFFDRQRKPQAAAS